MDENTESPEAKRLRQSLNFAFAYDATPATLERMCADAGMTPESARQVLDAFSKSFAAAVQFANRYRTNRGGYAVSLFGRRRYFGMPPYGTTHIEPSTRFDPKPAQTTTCGQCHTDCARWDIGPRRWYCLCKQTSIIQDDEPFTNIDFTKAEPQYAALNPEEVRACDIVPCVPR